MFDSIAKVLGVIGLIIAILFGLTWIGLEHYEFRKTKEEEIETEVMQNTRSYVRAKRQAIRKYRVKATGAENKVRRKQYEQMALDDASEIDNDKLPEDLRSYIDSLRNERLK